VPSVTRFALKSNRLPAFFCRISGTGLARHALEQALVLRFDWQCAQWKANPLLTASSMGSNCNGDLPTPAIPDPCSEIQRDALRCPALTSFDDAWLSDHVPRDSQLLLRGLAS
jgi:hypothetical protein